MATVYGFPTYSNLFNDVMDEINEPDRASAITPELVQKWVLDACQKISNNVLVMEKRVLRLVKDQADYYFSDTDTPVTGTGTINCVDDDVTGVTTAGTGTISTSGATVTGTGTAFKTELALGKAIIVGSEVVEVSEVNSDTECIIQEAFDDDLSGSSFTISSTKFTREVTVGSSIISDSVTRVVASITNPYQLVVSVPYTSDQSAQAFTVDTAVSEIPTKFYNIYYIDRLESDLHREVLVKDLDWLLGLQRRDLSFNDYTNWYTPYVAAQGRDATGRFLRFYPDPDANKDVTIHGYVRINPRNYSSTALSANIPLGVEFEPAIREYVKFKVYEFLKMPAERADAFANYSYCLRELKNTSVNVNIQQKVTYQ